MHNSPAKFATKNHNRQILPRCALIYVMDYKKYLQSDEWREVRRRIWQKARGKCAVCGEKGAAVHHKTYDRIGYEYDDDLELLCQLCHDRKHGRVWDAIKSDYKDLDTSEFPFGLS